MQRTETERMLVSAAQPLAMMDTSADAELKQRVLQFVMNLVERSTIMPELRENWYVMHGIEYREGALGTAPFVGIYTDSEGYSLAVVLPSGKSRNAGDWCNHVQLRFRFTGEELAQFFAFFDSSGMASYVENRRLLAETVNQMRFEEALAALEQ